MSTRARVAMAALAAAVSFVSAAAEADWRETYPELVFGMATGENLTDQQKRWEPVAEYLSEQLGVPVTLRNSNEYAVIIEGLNAGLVHLSWLGPAAYATAHEVIPGGVMPLALPLNTASEVGYYSVVIARADSGVDELTDLKGKKFAFGEPNSASTYLAPAYYFRELGMMEDGWFGETIFAGGDEVAILAVLNGTYDATATWFNSDDNNNVKVVEEKGLVPEGALRIIWKSPILPGGPFTVRADLDPDLAKELEAALLEFPTRDPEKFAAVSAGNWTGMAETSHDAFAEIIAMREAGLKAQKTQ